MQSCFEGISYRQQVASSHPVSREDRQTDVITIFQFWQIKLLNTEIYLWMEESIYNIIPKEYRPQAKQPVYRSKYPYDIPPTGSTFCHKTTSKPGISNLSGEFAVGLQAHTEYGNRSTLGYLKNDRKPSPDNFRKKNTGTMGNNSLPPLRNFSYDCSHKKSPVPRVQEKPVLGMKSDKNFIVANAVETILSSARKSQEAPNWFEKREYGQVPQYLSKIKDSIQQEYKMIQTLHEQNEEAKQMLSQEEVHEIREGLKRRWNEINQQYQLMTHVRLIDTTGLKRRKQDYERQLGEIEEDIKKLNKAYVFVE